MRMGEPVASALAAMESLEGGAIANPDEGRMVGHYWLRAPELAPDEYFEVEILQFGETLPWTTGFEAGSMFDEGFTHFELGFFGNTWSVDQGDSSGGDFAAVHIESINATPLSDDWLVSPPLDLAGFPRSGHPPAPGHFHHLGNRVPLAIPSQRCFRVQSDHT